MKNKKYQILYCDCPWRYNDPKGNDPALGGIQYDTMSNEDLAVLPIEKIADKNCLLFFWVTMPKLSEAFPIIESWGFKYTTCAFCWVKTNPKSGSVYSGLGHWVNGNAELCLLAKKGTPKRYEKNVKQIQMHPRGRHSAKPPVIRDEIVRVTGDLPRIELFARDRVEGWDAIGFDIDGKDIRESLNSIINNQ